MRPHRIVPTKANLRVHRRIAAIGIALAFGALATGFWIVQTNPSTQGRSPLGLIIVTIGSIGALVRLRGTNATLERQVRQLASYGRRFRAARAWTEIQPRGRLTHWHVVVAQWTDASGQVHEAVSDHFDYDPYPLLERERIEILADPFHPGLALVLESGLPPRKWMRLNREQRLRARAIGSVSPFLLWLTPKMLLGLVLGTLAYFVFRILDIRYGLVDWL